MAFIVVAECLGRELFAVGEEGGKGGTGADDGELFFWAEADDLVKISIDGAGMNEVTAGELQPLGPDRREDDRWHRLIG